MSPRTHWRHMGKLKTKKRRKENFPRKNQNQLLTILIPVLWCYYLKLRERVELNYHSSKALRAFSSRWTMYIRRLFHVRYSIASLKIENSIYFCLVPRKLKVEGEQKKGRAQKKRSSKSSNSSFHFTLAIQAIQLRTTSLNTFETHEERQSVKNLYFMSFLFAIHIHSPFVLSLFMHRKWRRIQDLQGCRFKENFQDIFFVFYFIAAEMVKNGEANHRKIAKMVAWQLVSLN